jgi:cytochrome c peroxidase
MIRCLLIPLILWATFLSAESDQSFDKEPIMPLPIAPPELNMEKVFLGRQLFEDVQLSKNNTVSCASCHNLQNGGVDGLVHSFGVDHQEGNINAPTVFNSGFNFRQFWNGRAKSLEDQVDGPVQNPKEMGSAWPDVVAKIKKDHRYMAAFAKLYPDGVDHQSIKDAIATFEKSLVTSNSRFDQYLRGNQTILTSEEQLGYRRFKSYGCIACHQGMNVGGNMYQTMGVMGNYFADRGTPMTEADFGRFSVTKVDEDKFIFRVPSLRNVEKTAPYFHDGSAKQLSDAVRVMAKYQLGRKLTAEEIASIVAFLKTLTGDMPPSTFPSMTPGAK